MRFTSVMLLLMGVVAAAAWYRSGNFAKLRYCDHRNDTAVTLDGEAYRLRELAVYIAMQEQEVQKQARVYNLEQPQKYWNAHVNGSFVRSEAKSAVMEKAVHDLIFYRMAEEEGLHLTTEEAAYMENQKMDFWNDLEEEGQARLGISTKELDEAFLRMAHAQKKQRQLAEDEGVDYVAYNENGPHYQALLQEHDYVVNQALWQRLDFGNITVNDALEGTIWHRK